jgi:hypothetical protein
MAGQAGHDVIPGLTGNLKKDLDISEEKTIFAVQNC